MKTKFKFLAIAMMVLAITLTSCEKEGLQGPIGPAGPMGEQGIAGPEGPKGEDGSATGVPGPKGDQGEQGPAGDDGATGPAGPKGDTGATGPAGEDGTDGSNGADGADGNANVQTFTFNTASLSGDLFSLVFAELTQDVLDNDALLFYIKRSGFISGYYPIPGISAEDLMEVELNPSTLNIFFYNRTDGAANSIPVGRYTKVKAVIIKSTGSSKSSTRKNSLNKLKEAGVDIKSYHDVMDYFGLDY